MRRTDTLEALKIGCACTRPIGDASPAPSSGGLVLDGEWWGLDAILLGLAVASVGAAVAGFCPRYRTEGLVAVGTGGVLYLLGETGVVDQIMRPAPAAPIPPPPPPVSP